MPSKKSLKVSFVTSGTQKGDDFLFLPISNFYPVQKEQCSHINNILKKISAIILHISLKYQEILKLYKVQCSVVHSRGSSAVQYIVVHCKSAICHTVKFNAVQGIEFLCIKTICIFLLNFAVKCTVWEISAV